MLADALHIVESGKNLAMGQMADTLGEIMDGRCAEKEIERLLVALHEKGETVEEIAGAAKAMRARMTPIRTRRTGLLDTCGTGGDGAKTFNISTVAAIVTAAAGVPVAKHGNRAITSRSGSADVLAALGVNVEADVVRVEACLDELGICFCFAPLLHGAMKHVATVRRKIGTPTIFNILGPLVNPASAEFQLLGVGNAGLQPLLAESMLLLNAEERGTTLSAIAPRTIVVHGCDGLDEVTLSGPTHVIDAAGGRLMHYDWTPSDFELVTSSKDSLLVRDAVESAAVIRAILDGRPGPPRDIVIANAAAGLYTAGRVSNLRDGARLGTEAIDSGKAQQILTRLVERSR